MSQIDIRREQLATTFQLLANRCKSYDLPYPRSGGWPHQELEKVLALVEHQEALLIELKNEIEELKRRYETSADL